MLSVVRYFGKKPILHFLRTLFSLRKESAVDDTAEDFFKIIPLYLSGSNLSSLLWIGVIRPWFQILGKMPELRVMFKNSSFEFVVCIFYPFV
jgi:hypothetical protein